MKRTILCLVALSLIFTFGCGKRENRVIAKVGDRTITIGAFEKAAETLPEKFLPRTNDLEGKKELLDIMINKEVMALKALSAGYEKEDWFIKYWGKFKGGYSVATLENNYVIKKVKVSDSEVKDYFDRMHYEYALSQILVANEEEAISIREQLLGGADFAELARKYSLAPEASSGGELGSITIGAMFWWVEEALFEMKEGDISWPLRTPSGWSILKVQSIQKITPEKDIVHARKKLEANQMKKMLDEMKSKIEKDIGLVFFADAISLVYNHLPPAISPLDLMSNKVTQENAAQLEIPEQYHGMVMAQYADGSYTIKDFIEIFNSMPIPDRPVPRMGKESIVNTIHRKIWDKVLPVYAEKTLKVLEDPEVAADLQRRKEIILTKYLYEDQVGKHITVSDLEVQDYYNTHKNEILTPEKRSFSIILLGDEAKAKEVSGRAKRGENFKKLVKEFSEDAGASKTEGSTGLVERGMYADYDEVAFSLPEGQVSDPFQVPRGWAVIKVDQIEASQPVPYASAAGSTKEYLKESRAEKMIKERLEKWRKEYPLEINEGNLQKAKLTRTRPSDEELKRKDEEARAEMMRQQQMQQEQMKELQKLQEQR